MKDFAAGGIAAGISETIVAPLERIKILLQVQRGSAAVPVDKRYKGFVDALVRIPKEQGVRSLWRGNFTHVVRCWPSYALNFAFKETYRKVLVKDTQRTSNFALYFLGNLLSGGLAGATTLCFIYPLDFVETRLAADIGHSHVHREFTGIYHCMSKIVKSDGIAGLYRGFGASVLGVFIYRAAYFGLFDTAKASMPPEKMTLLMSWFIAQTVTTTSGFLSYPFDTVRRRMMMQSGLASSEHLYKSTKECWQLMYRQEGIHGFYQGAMTNVARSLGGALVLVIYDRIKPLFFSDASK